MTTRARKAAAAIEPRTVADLWAAEELQRISALGLRRELEPIESPQGAEVRIRGRTYVNFSSNDYLGLANHPAVRAACSAAAQRHGVGSGASRLLVGDSETHHELEQDIARWLGSERALLFGSGYAANLGIATALAGPGDVIFSDQLNHASLIDGCRISRAKTVVYPHADVDGLRRLLRAHPGRRQLVLTESVFSMDGDRAPLPELAEICEELGAALVVDEAHALGVLGPRGAGLCADAGVEGAAAVRMGTLGKALGTFGAFAVASSPVADLLLNRARTLIYSTSLPPALCAAARVAIALAAAADLQRQLWRNARQFSEGLRCLGVSSEASSSIFPVVFGAPERALEASARLRSRGLLVKAIRPPTVPPGTSRLRFSICASHTDEHIDRALDALASLGVGGGH